jgi:hypothetical protein
MNTKLIATRWSIGGLIFGLLLLSTFSWQVSAQTSRTPQFAATHTAFFTPTNGTNLKFGAVPIGQSVQKIFSFVNKGNDTLFVRSLELSSDSGFTIQFATLTLPPNKSGKVIVQFAPMADHNYSATLSFAVANGVAPPTLTLSGDGLLANSDAGSFLTTRTLTRDSQQRSR